MKNYAEFLTAFQATDKRDSLVMNIKNKCTCPDGTINHELFSVNVTLDLLFLYHTWLHTPERSQ